MFRDVKLKNYNFRLILLVLAAVVFGIIMVNSANPYLTKRNIMGGSVALFLMLGVSVIDYRKYYRFAWLLYVFNLVLLLLVKIPNIGYNVKGATRWISVAGFQFQPSEVTKVVLIVFIAAYIEKRQYELNTIKNLSMLAILVLIPLALIKSQPDLSTTIVTAMIAITVIFMGGLSLKLVTIVSTILIPLSIAVLWYIQQPWQTLLHGWQQRRVLSFLHPQDYLNSESYQQFNSMLAIGSGKLWGNGLNNNLPSSVKNANYLPEPQTDFIFSIIGEDLGFIGTFLTIILILSIVFTLFNISRKCDDIFGRLIVAGAACYIGYQSFINIGVVTLLLPNTGLPLPFISYGLTSLFSTCILMGICLNIGLHKNKGGIYERRSYRR